MTINSSIGVEHHQHHNHHHHNHHHNNQSHQLTSEKGVQVIQDPGSANLKDDDDNKDEHHKNHQQLKKTKKKIHNDNSIRCSSPPTSKSVFVTLDGSVNKSTTPPPLLIPPKPIQRRSKQSNNNNTHNRRLTTIVHQCSDVSNIKPVDLNNNKSSKQHHKQNSKIAVVRQQSCPFPGHRSSEVTNHHNHINNYRHSHHPQTLNCKPIKEKITRVDMVPAPTDQNILPPLDNCENNNINTNTNVDIVDEHNKIKHETNNKKSQQLSMVQQLSEWKDKLSRELDVYQDILKQRQLLRSSHSSSANPKKVTTAHNSHHHRPSSRSKTMKLMTNTKNLVPTTATTATLIRRSDSFEDSLGDSWEETETSTTNSTGNNTNCSTPTGETAKPVTPTNEENIGSEIKHRVLTKKSASQKTTSGNKNLMDTSVSVTENGKRRSTSFNRKVKIITQYEKVLQAMENDKTWQKEIAFGRRIGMYRFRGDIGNGNFSQVKIAVHTLTKEKVAVKILDKSRLDIKTQRMLTREIRTMETLHHPNLIRIFEVIESYSKHFIVMELAPGGELFQVISTNGRFSESEAKFFFSQIISAIDHMHQHNLIHRDIKAENVFFSDPNTVKVGDFGFSTRISSKDELLSTFCGSPPYAAPELFRDESYRGPYVDYWALGVLLYFIVTGMMPFRAQNIVALKKLILDCRYDIPGYISVECCQLIAGFLQPEPLKRFTLEQARSTRWLCNQPMNRSLPKYDLKNSYAKLIKQRTMVSETNETKLKLVLGSASSDSSKNNQEDLDHSVSGSGSGDSSKRINKRHTVYADMHYSNGAMNGANGNKSTLNGTASKTLDRPNTPSLLNDDEKETFHQMMLLGIDEKILNNHVDKGSHSHIVGTFRILMHRVLRESAQNRKSLHNNNGNNDNLDINGDSFNPIRRSTSINVAPLDRIWAHYANKKTTAALFQQQQNLLKSNNGTAAATAGDGNLKCPPRSAKIKKNNETTMTIMTKTSQSSNDSGKSSLLTPDNSAETTKPPNRLKKIFSNGRVSASPEPSPSPPLSATIEPKDSTKTESKHTSLESEPKPIEEMEIKEKIRKEDQSPANNNSLKKTVEPQQQQQQTLKSNDLNGIENNGNSVGGRLSRSFRTIKQLLTESNICGNNVNSVVQPHPMTTKPHVIHKTTTLQIIPKNCQQALLNQQMSTNQPIWSFGNGKRKSKLWRSQTTPDVSLIDGTSPAHHSTLPCYCDQQQQLLMMNPNTTTKSVTLRSNKKSFTNNRCTII